MELARPYQIAPFNAVVLLAAGNASKTLVAAPGAGKALNITKWSYRSTTSAASITAGVLHEGPNLDTGIQLPTNTALIVTPASAGPAGVFIVEGWTENV